MRSLLLALHNSGVQVRCVTSSLYKKQRQQFFFGVITLMWHCSRSRLIKILQLFLNSPPCSHVSRRVKVSVLPYDETQGKYFCLTCKSHTQLTSDLPSNQVCSRGRYAYRQSASFLEAWPLASNLYTIIRKKELRRKWWECGRTSICSKTLCVILMEKISGLI